MVLSFLKSCRDISPLRNALVASIMAVFLLACGSSNPILGTWKVDEVAQLQDGQYQVVVDHGTMTFTEEEVIVSLDGRETKFKASYRKSEDGKTWQLSPDQGNTYITAEFNGSDEMFAIFNGKRMRFIRQW
jgi:hypothetical protein